MKISKNNLTEHNNLLNIGPNDHHEKFTKDDHLLVDHTGLPGVPTANVTGGYAPLNSNNKIPDQYLNITSNGLHFSGNWNPNSGNYPSNPSNQSYYNVIEDGYFDNIQWNRNDWLVYIDDIVGWTKLDNTPNVNSVNNKIGNVQLTLDDIPDGSNRKLLQIDDTVIGNNPWSSSKISNIINDGINNSNQLVDSYLNQRVNDYQPDVISVNGIQGNVQLSIFDFLPGITINDVQVGQILRYQNGQFILSDDNVTQYYSSGRGFFIGGSINSSTYVSDIEYIGISQQMNGIHFCNLSENVALFGGTSNGYNGRGVYSGGINQNTMFNVIKYFSLIDDTGGINLFGNLMMKRWHNSMSSNSTNNRGLIIAGLNDFFERVSIISYINISATSNSIYHGNIGNGQERFGQSAASNSTNNRCVISCGGLYNEFWNSQLYTTIGTSGNAQNLSSLNIKRSGLSNVSNGINNKCLHISGSYDTNIKLTYVEYSDISTNSNGYIFGEINEPLSYFSSVSNGERNYAVYGGGSNSSNTVVSHMKYFIITNRSNSGNFGNLLRNRCNHSSISNY